MKLFPASKISSLVLELLEQGPKTAKELHAHINKQEGDITIQSIYYNLRNMISCQWVISANKYYSLNLFYVKRLERFCNNSIKGSVIPKTITKTKQVFVFPTLETLDIFWSDLHSRLLEKAECTKLFSFHPREFFLVGRNSFEQDCHNNIRQAHKTLFILSKYSKSIDQQIQKKFLWKKHLRYSAAPGCDYPDNYFFSVIGDIIIEVTLDEDISKTLHTLFNEQKNFNNNFIKQVEKVFSAQGMMKLKIYRDQKKADRLTKYFVKYFA